MPENSKLWMSHVVLPPRQERGDPENGRKLLWLLLALDAGLILLDTLWGAGAMADLLPGRPYVVQIHQDFGIAECFNFVKWALAAYLLFTLTPAPQRHVWHPAGWAMVLMLCDDALMIHERVAVRAGRFLDEDLGFASKTTAELGFVAVLATAVFALLFLSRHRATLQGRSHANGFIILMILLGFFGVEIDQVHSALNIWLDSKLAHSIGAIVENAGEMIAISLIAVQAMRVHLWAAHNMRSGR